MLSFVISRFLQALLALLLVTVVVFLLGRATGDPTHLMVRPDATEEERLELKEALGLDRPLHIQYGIYIRDLLKGDMGVSLRSKDKVTDLLRDRLPASFTLALAAMIFVLVVGVPLGVLSAVKRGTWLDTVARGIALLGQSMPSFWLGIVLIQLFAVVLGVLPVSGTGGPLHYVLPAFTLSAFVLAGVVRLMRTSMLEVLDSEFVKLARIKGLSERAVIWKHAFRNSLIPVITFGGVYFAIFITLAIVVEVVFAWPGLGRLTYNAIIFRDYPLLQGVVLLAAGMVMVVSFLVDILYAFVDPRIRVGRRGVG